ncbi:sialidase-4-like [Pelobates fuscus]|uniref:sialidase-4-like n=1 Tax=Pelobates fuscus TaxID=191477 RepID=UPI002FE43716
MGSRHVPARTVLFEKEKNGVTYRVPALLYIPRWATMLAFAEERLSADDAHANLLVLRRGKFYRNYVEWEDMRAVERAHLPGHRSMNPCPIYDDFTGQLFLFFIAVLGRTTESYQITTGRNLARLCYVTSLDHGKSWSNVTDLTVEVIGKSIKGEWATFALGPGHGIQLKSGRLLVPAYTYHIECRDCFGILCRTTPRAFAFRSDDHGKNWKLGELVPNLQTVECQLVSVDEEDGNNVLYCNARSPLGFRVHALSSDEGIVFQPGQLIEKLVETPNGCHGSVIGFPAPLSLYSRFNTNKLILGGLKSNKASEMQHCCKKKHHVKQPKRFGENVLLSNQYSKFLQKQKETFCTDQKFQTPTWVLYSHPTSSQSRVNLGVYLSPYPRDADSWAGPWVIYEGPSAYSDLAYLELSSGELGGTGSPPVIAFACLYENGLISPYEQISFSIFTLYEVIQSLPPNSLVFHEKQNEDRQKVNCVMS